VVKKLVNNPNILAFEILNEPFPGSLYTDPQLFLNSTYGDLVNLQPFYDKLAQAVRVYDKDIILLFEPLVTNGEVLARHAGFNHPSGNNRNAVLSFHTYCDLSPVYAYDCELAGQAYAQDCADIIYDVQNGKLDYCWLLYQQDFEVRRMDSQALGVPMMVTEYGSYTNDLIFDNDTILFVNDLCYQYGVSCVIWDIHAMFERPEYISAVSRVYASAVAGTNILQSYNATTRVYNLSFNIDTKIFLPTEIFVPTVIHYSEGYSVFINPSQSVSWQRQQPNLVKIFSKPTTKNGQKITVTITPLVKYNSC
jgi:endoglycosylceramidase